MQHHVIGHFACDIRDVENALSNILREEIARDIDCKPLLNALDSFKRMCKCFVVANVGDNDIVLGYRRKMGCANQQLLQLLGVLPLLGRNEECVDALFGKIRKVGKQWRGEDSLSWGYQIGFVEYQ